MTERLGIGVGRRTYSDSVAATRLVFDHDIELSPAIVWDALVDDELVSGWLGEATIDPVVGGDYRLSFLGSPEFPPLDGRIEALDPRRALVVASSEHGRVSFQLTERVGGVRGTWTRLRLDVDVAVDPAFAGRIRANWLAALDHLEQLLRGHPVDWGVAASDPGASARARDSGGA